MLILFHTGAKVMILFWAEAQYYLILSPGLKTGAIRNLIFNSLPISIEFGQIPNWAIRNQLSIVCQLLLFLVKHQKIAISMTYSFKSK